MDKETRAELEELTDHQLLERLRVSGRVTIGARTPKRLELMERVAEAEGTYPMPEGTVRIGPYRVRLAAPAQRTLRLDVLYAAQSSRPRSLFAALAMCWRGAGAPGISLKAHSYDVLAMGGAATELLLERNYHLHELQAAALAAFNVLTGGLAEYVSEIGDTANFTGQKAAAADGPV